MAYLHQFLLANCGNNGKAILSQRFSLNFITHQKIGNSTLLVLTARDIQMQNTVTAPSSSARRTNQNMIKSTIVEDFHKNIGSTSMSDVEMVQCTLSSLVIAKNPSSPNFNRIYFTHTKNRFPITLFTSKQISISMLMSEHRKYYHRVNVHDAGLPSPRIPLNARSTNPLWLDITMMPYMAKPEEFVTVHEGSLELEEAANTMADECFLYSYQGIFYNMPSRHDLEPPFCCITQGRYIGVFPSYIWDSVRFELWTPGNRVATYFTIQSLVLGEQKVHRAI
ncbi:uncharacterized protein EDB91DRAFT_1088221 [Suillus paluster]|uniref:uncharacterized protein n=1 Tax=Suillus paluster TaxID=48578 RepID=UPI001B872115|nr:uncharacterized protein EDB91DRAFT_1088221 [Suillus paluster]KAG1722177.1 hypothetical protein EDB91DRAFT_1088221 [Suillus paluster]